MGERLVVSLYTKNGSDTDDAKRIAAIYFHWSGYFVDAIRELKLISDSILKAEQNKQDVILQITDDLTSRGGGVRGTDSDIEYMKSLYPDHQFVMGYRNEGIITLLPDGLKGFDLWAEHTAGINLDTHEIRNMCSYEPYPFYLFDRDHPDDPGNITDLGEAGYIESRFINAVRYGDAICDIDPFWFTCETAGELCDFLDQHYHSDDSSDNPF